MSITAADAAQGEPGVNVPDVLPSRLVARVDDAFETFDDADLRLIGSWLERASAHWPRRRSLRREPSRHGTRIDLRHTMRASRTTGWETMRLVRSHLAVARAGWSCCVTSAGPCSHTPPSTCT